MFGPLILFFPKNKRRKGKKKCKLKQAVINNERKKCHCFISCPPMISLFM